MSINYESKRVIRDYADMGLVPYISFDDIESISIYGQYAHINGTWTDQGEQQVIWMHADSKHERNKLKELMRTLKFNGGINYERYDKCL